MIRALMHRSVLAALLAGSLSFASAATAGILGVDLSSSTAQTQFLGFVEKDANGLNGNGQTGGWSFQLSETKTVTSLGYWDEGANGLDLSHEVGLWSNGGALLGSVVVNDPGAAVDPGTVVNSRLSLGRWIFADLGASLVLAPGAYSVAGLIDVTLDPVRFDELSGNTMGEIFAPDVSFLQTAFGPANGGFLFPDRANPTNVHGFYGGNLLFESNAAGPPSVVPLPAALPLFLGALAGLGGLGLMKRRRAAA